MKKYSLLLIITALLLLSACLKKQEEIPVKDPNIQFAKDTVIINKFLADSNINALRLDQTGVYYQIITSGTGTVKPQLNSVVEVKIKGRLLRGKVFTEAKDTLSLILRNQIYGLQLGIPLIKKGGKIRLILASYYAYDTFGNRAQTVPPNAVVDFDIELLDIR